MQTFQPIFPFAHAALFFATLSLGLAHCSKHPHWSYEGPTGPRHWGDLLPEYAACKRGQEQSPINIDPTGPLPKTTEKLEFGYGPAEIVLENNGHTIQANLAQGQALQTAHGPYELVQFHLHSPSEESLAGRHADLVTHLVHRNAAGQLAVVALLFNRGAAQFVLDPILNQAPETPGRIPLVQNPDLKRLLPEDRSFYTFPGSLTTPPCSEGVTWYVLKAMGTVSSEQVDHFRRLFPASSRPLQPLNARQIQESL